MRALEPAAPPRSEGRAVFPKRKTRRPRARRLHADPVHVCTPQPGIPVAVWRGAGGGKPRQKKRNLAKASAHPPLHSARSPPTGLGRDCQRLPIVGGPRQPTQHSLRANASIRKQSSAIDGKMAIRFRPAALNVGGGLPRFARGRRTEPHWWGGFRPAHQRPTLGQGETRKVRAVTRRTALELTHESAVPDSDESFKGRVDVAQSHIIFA